MEEAILVTHHVKVEGQSFIKKKSVRTEDNFPSRLAEAGGGVGRILESSEQSGH